MGEILGFRIFGEEALLIIKVLKQLMKSAKSKNLASSLKNLLERFAQHFENVIVVEHEYYAIDLSLPELIDLQVVLKLYSESCNEQVASVMIACLTEEIDKLCQS
jgi:hypothetical protein